jgi:hypothetical protein
MNMKQKRNILNQDEPESNVKYLRKQYFSNSTKLFVQALSEETWWWNSISRVSKKKLIHLPTF